MSVEKKGEFHFNMEVKKTVQDAIEEWFEWKREDIGIFVDRTLDSSLSSLVLQLAGLRQDGEFWRVHPEDSAAGEYLRRKVGESVREWLDSRSGDLPKLPDSALKEIRREYLACLKGELKKAVYDLARRQAGSYAAQIAKELMDEVLERGSEG